MSVEGLRHIAGELLPSDEITPWPWGAGEVGDRLPSAVIYTEHLFCAVLDRVGNNSDGEDPRSCLNGACDSPGSSHGLVWSEEGWGLVICYRQDPREGK